MQSKKNNLGSMNTRIKEFLISSWEWVVAGIGVLGLFMILVCYVFCLTIFILRTFF